MNVTPATKIHDLIEHYPFLIDFLGNLNPKFKLLKNPVMRNTVGRAAALEQVAAIGGIKVEKLIAEITAEIERKSGAQRENAHTTVSAPKSATEPQAKHEVLKGIIRDLHAGKDFGEAKRKFSELVKDIDASQIAAMEQQLMNEGMPESEIKRLCDVHVQVFKEVLEAKDVPQVPAGHPVSIFMSENRELEKLICEAETILGTIEASRFAETFGVHREALSALVDKLLLVDIHFTRKENELFPQLEKHGITAPSQVMWAIDDDIRNMLKKIRRDFRNPEVKPAFIEQAREALQALKDMIYKEEHILFPLAVDTLSEKEWDSVASGGAMVGYAWIKTPEGLAAEAVSGKEAQPKGNVGAIPLNFGSLSADQVSLMLITIPLDLTFVDEDDTVRFCSGSAERIFSRSPGVIGRKVQNCHPPKSLAMVQQILDDFRAGAQNVAEFWIQSNGRFLHIRYIAMRDAKQRYRGCLEVVQDVAKIKALEGEKRLLQY